MRLETDEENIRDLAPTGVRIPSKLKSMLKEKTKENNRSMNAEIVARLEESFNAATAIPEDLIENFEVLYKLQKEIIEEKDKTTNKLEKIVKILLNEIEETKKLANKYEEFMRMPKTNHK